MWSFSSILSVTADNAMSYVKSFPLQKLIRLDWAMTSSDNVTYLISHSNCKIEVRRLSGWIIETSSSISQDNDLLLCSNLSRWYDRWRRSRLLLDVVAPQLIFLYNLWRGQGTVVEILAADGAAFCVEFSERSGRTYESVGLRPEQQTAVLRFEPVLPDSKPGRCNTSMSGLTPVAADGRKPGAEF